MVVALVSMEVPAMATFEHLSIDAGDLREALNSHMDEATWVVDLETGEVIMAPYGESLEEDGDEPWEESERYMVVTPLESHEGFQIMEDYVETLPEGEGARALERALRLPRPFRCFKDTLSDFPDLRERWFKFHDAKMLEYAQAWLEDNLPGARLRL